jgi:hypothetical protein
MEHEFKERRRSVRVSTESGTIAALHVAVPVRLLDLSSDGLLLACEAPLRVGATVRVVSRIAGRPLQVHLCVRHVSRRRDAEVGGYVFGGSFPSFDPAARQTVKALLGDNRLCPVGEPDPQIDRGRPETPARGGVRRDRPVQRPEHPRPEQSSWVAHAPPPA